MPTKAYKLYKFLSEKDHETVLQLAKQEIGTTSYSNWNDGNLSPDELLICEYVDRQFATIKKQHLQSDDEPGASWRNGWDDGITVAIASEVAWEAIITSDVELEDCPATVGEILEQVETNLDSIQRGIVFGEKLPVYKSDIRFLEGKQACLDRICTNWPEEDKAMVDVLLKFQLDSQRWHDQGGRWNGLKLEVETDRFDGYSEESTQAVINTKKQVHSLDDLYHVPGFINEVMKITLDSAPYPNRSLAFCGAISLMSLLTGRRVTFQGIATNLYILSLALSASGKDWPRKVNARLLNDAGIGELLGDSFASGEGLEDAINLSNSMLFQVDEFDTIVKSMADNKESRFATITQNLLRLYTSSTSMYYLRRKANDESPKIINNPHLSLFATCVPSSLLDSVSSRMLTNGLLARMVVIEAGQRGIGQRAKPIEMDESIQQQIAFWRDFRCGDENLSHLNPKVKELEATEKALSMLDDFRKYCDSQWNNRSKSHDEGGCAIWGRANELAIKLSLLYTCSAKPFDLVVDCDAVKWATSFAKHHVERMINLAHKGVSESPFDKLCNKLISKIDSMEDGIQHADLLRFSKVDSKQFRSAISTLHERGQIHATKAKAKNGREQLVYVLT